MASYLVVNRLCSKQPTYTLGNAWERRAALGSQRTHRNVGSEIPLVAFDPRHGAQKIVPPISAPQIVRR